MQEYSNPIASLDALVDQHPRQFVSTFYQFGVTQGGIKKAECGTVCITFGRSVDGLV